MLRKIHAVSGFPNAFGRGGSVNEIKYRNRRAAYIETESVRLQLPGGGHVAEILHKATGVNPLWAPPWPSIEPSAYRRATHPEYGPSDEAHVLSGLMGQNFVWTHLAARAPRNSRRVFRFMERDRLRPTNSEAMKDRLR